MRNVLKFFLVLIVIESLWCPALSAITLRSIISKKIPHFSLFTSVSYDDNIILSPYSAEEDPSGTGDWENTTVFITRINPWSWQRYFLRFRYDFYNCVHQERHNYDIQGHSGNLILEHQGKSLDITCKATYNKFFLDHEEYLNRVRENVSIAMRHANICMSEFSVNYQVKSCPQMKSLDAQTIGAGLKETFLFKCLRSQASLGYTFNEERVDIDYLSFTEHKLSMDTQTSLPFSFVFSLQGIYTIKDFSHPYPVNYGGGVREDNKRSFNCTILRKLSKKCNLNLQYSLIINHSNFNHASIDKQYRKNVYSISIITHL